MNDVVEKVKVVSGQLVEKRVTDLLDKLDQIEKSLKSTEVLSSRAEVVEKNGGFFSGITGKSDRELASIVKGIGANVKVTQEVIKFLIELAQDKADVQDCFLEALDSKITQQEIKLDHLSQNDAAIDENAKQAETSILTLYKQVRSQVKSESELRKNVDLNMEKIDSLYEELEAQAQKDAEQSETISKVVQAIRKKAKKQEEFSQFLKLKEKSLNEIAHNVEEQNEKLSILESNLEQKANKLDKTISAIKENNAADNIREERIIKLEEKILELKLSTESKNPKMTSYVAIILSIFSLLVSSYNIFLI